MDCFIESAQPASLGGCRVSAWQHAAAAGCTGPFALSALGGVPTCAAAVGSPCRSMQLFLPRLTSIPEAAERVTSAATGVADDDVASAVTALQLLEVPQHHMARQEPDRRRHGAIAAASSSNGSDAAADAAAAAASSSSSCGSSCREEEGQPDEAPAVVGLLAEDPSVVASAWAINIRHFTDCMPLSADSVCDSSTCPALAGPLGSSVDAPAPPSSADAELQPLQQCGSSSTDRGVPVCSHGHDQHHHHHHHQQSGPSGSGRDYDDDTQGLDLHDLDALEWQPWDRVAKWLEGNNTAAAAAAAAAGTAALVASSTQQQPGCSSSQPAAQEACGGAGASHIGPTGAACGCSSSARPSTSCTSSCSHHTCDVHQLPTAAAPAAASSVGRVSSDGQRQQQQAGSSCSKAIGSDADADGVEDEALFDAPDWWSESVVARLQQQRQQFHGSWWSRFKIMTGLAAQRASCTLEV